VAETVTHRGLVLVEEAKLYTRPPDPTLRVSADFDQHLAWLHADLEFGFAEIFLHNINTNQDEFIDTFAEKVLPRLR